jgi:hypothetical protein
MTTLSRPAAAVDSTTRRRDPVLAASAVASFVVTFAVLLVPHDAVPDDASAAQVTSFFTTHYTLQQSQTVMHALGAVALLVFVGRLAAVVRRLERADEAGSRIVLAAGSAVVAIIVLSMGFVSAAIFLTGSIDGELQEMLYMMGWDFHFKVAYLVPLVLLPACHVLRREHAAPAALTWSGLALGLFALVSTLGNLSKDTMFVQYPAFMLFLVWMLVAGLVLGLRGVAQRPH